tara:strand:+ start:399 stop:1235 length:837 start_codon:yes stop_codon:yes gene_type:complete
MFSPYSGGYGEYGVSAPRVVEVPVPVPVPFPMKGTVTDPGMTGRNVDLSEPLPAPTVEAPKDLFGEQDVVDGRYVSKGRSIGLPRVIDGLLDSVLGLGGIKTDFDRRGTWGGGESSWGYGKPVESVKPKGPTEVLNPSTSRTSDQPISPYLDPRWIANRDNYMNMIQDRDMRRSLAYYDMYADRAYQNNLRNLAAQTPWIKDAAYFREALPSNIENLSASAQRRYLNATQAKVNLAEAAAIPAREAIKAALMGRFQPGNVAPATIANPGSYSPGSYSA